MSAPSEKHMEVSGEICSRITEFGEPAQEVIAAALASAEREGMKRAVEIAQAEAKRLDRLTTEAEIIAAAIISEAGEG